MLKPPLPAEDTARLKALFGALEGIGLDVPRRPQAAAPQPARTTP
jgi:hypothetical protein